MPPLPYRLVSPGQSLQKQFVKAMDQKSLRILRYALIAVTIIHLFIIFGIRFQDPFSNFAHTKDVTLAIRLSNEKNKHADYFAQADQKGAGLLDKAERITSPSYSPFDADLMEKVSPVNEESVTRVEASKQQTPVLYTRLSWEEIKKQLQNLDDKKLVESEHRVAAQIARIASLEAEYSRQQQEFSKKTNERTVDSISAQKDNSAQYVNNFRQKIELIGNKNYPAAAKERHLSGDVRLMVVLKPNGDLKMIRLLGTSGSAILDEAAKESVRDAAPFDRFPREMMDYTELRIIRTWRFSDLADSLQVND